MTRKIVPQCSKLVKKSPELSQNISKRLKISNSDASLSERTCCRRLASIRSFTSSQCHFTAPHPAAHSKRSLLVGGDEHVDLLLIHLLLLRRRLYQRQRSGYPRRRYSRLKRTRGNCRNLFCQKLQYENKGFTSGKDRDAHVAPNHGSKEREVIVETCFIKSCNMQMRALPAAKIGMPTSPPITGQKNAR